MAGGACRQLVRVARRRIGVDELRYLAIVHAAVLFRTEEVRVLDLSRAPT